MIPMIDIESDIYSAVAEELRQKHEGVNVCGEYVEKPAEFPTVTLVEVDNRVLERMRTRNIENAVSVMWEANIYSNKVPGKKAEAKAIAATLDAKMAEIGFTRTFKSQVANLNDATIFRIVCRYEAVIDKDFWIYQN